MLKFSAIALLALVGIGTAQAGEPVGSRYFGQVISGNTTTAIFAASANVSGATIRTLTAADSAGTQMFVTANYPDGTSRVIYSLVSTSGGAAVNSTLPYPVDLAPGIGLSVTMTSGTNAGQIYLTYDFR
ncbi:MAG: hypothetical protein JWO51_2199 [Rhodospirillales bacterium]|nr:hypothetical protein [Rhodospirillales bacterium]